MCFKGGQRRKLLRRAPQQHGRHEEQRGQVQRPEVHRPVGQGQVLQPDDRRQQLAAPDCRVRQVHEGYRRRAERAKK